MIVISREHFLELEQATSREWLVSNERGSYASSTLIGLNTRRDHGLLVAALPPSNEPTVLLAKLDEEVEVGGQVYRLGVNEFPNNVINPDGYLYLQQVTIEGNIPTWHYQAGRFRLTKTIRMEPQRDTTLVTYTLAENSEPINLTLLPFCDYRPHHTLTQGKTEWRFEVQVLENGFSVTAHDSAQPYRVLVTPRVSFTPLDLWYWRFQYRVERERGQPHSGDLFVPGLLRTRLEPGETVTVTVTSESDDTLQATEQPSPESTETHPDAGGLDFRNRFSSRPVRKNAPLIGTRRWNPQTQIAHG